MKRDFLTYLKEAWNPDLHPEDFIKNHPTLNLTNGDINISLTYDEKKKKYVGTIFNDNGDKETKSFKFSEIKNLKKNGWKEGTSKISYSKSEEPDMKPEIMTGNSKPEDIGSSDPHDDSYTKLDNGEKKEFRIAKCVDDWISRNDTKKSNPNIDDIVDNSEDHFYAIKMGSSTKKSDIMVVHDKEEHNKDKKNVGDNDKVFFIEAKADDVSRTFNPTVIIVQDNDSFKFEYAGFEIPKNLNDHKEKLMYNDLMSRGDLGKIITDIISKKAQPLVNTFSKIIKLYGEIANIKDEEVKTTGYEFPRDFKYLPSIFDYIVRYCLCDKTIDKWNELDKILKEMNINKQFLIDIFNKNNEVILQGVSNNKEKPKIDSLDNIIENLSDLEKQNYMFYLVKSSLNVATVKIGGWDDNPDLNEDQKEVKTYLDKITFAIKSWYCDHKKAAYIEYGPSDNFDGGLYIFDKNYDPLNLQEKMGGKITTFEDAVLGAKCYILKSSHRKTMRLETKLKLIANGYQIEDILNDKFKMKPGDDKNDKTKFFKESI